MRRAWDAAAAESLASVAFCCISTGVFGFPQAEAAQIAVEAVRAWLDANPDAGLRVVFDVFLDEDLAIYRRLLG
ncbi:macro domain-containing protein [Collinsella ihumii]|uniref:macro domain-containing protein n=1 Tax=Collinsella ihumii TaxID=1720204 RepID=UPI00083307CE|nr:macro domain-containing protein [Collinsella ihumii]